MPVDGWRYVRFWSITCSAWTINSGPTYSNCWSHAPVIYTTYQINSWEISELKIHPDIPTGIRVWNLALKHGIYGTQNCSWKPWEGPSLESSIVLNPVLENSYLEHLLGLHSEELNLGICLSRICHSLESRPELLHLGHKRAQYARYSLCLCHTLATHTCTPCQWEAFDH